MEQLTGTMSSVPNSNNYENMSHKPQINGVELTGNKTSEELGLGGGEVTRQELFHTQIGVGNRLDGGRRRVKKYLWSFLRTAPAGQVRL
ncbi:hypothetical protein [Blautia obeum]|uniref:Uncharacterized protein n=1 Tax=Blautia obeum TaxID=40520 RepID=A0A173WC37_9FIRM|nr:hypothetical protein [Blautia obeum]CUN36005.1 Uncharacterised protein [Blautia obeum]